MTRTYYLSPVVRAGNLVGVMTFGFTLGRESTSLAVTKQSPPGPVGSYSFLGEDGVAFMSWNESLVGHAPADPAELAGVAPSGSRQIASRTGDIVVAARVSSWSESTSVYLVFTAAPDELYRDLRRGQEKRDLTLVGVVLAAVVGLTLVHRRREQETRRNARRLDALLHGAHDLITVLDGTGRMGFVSSAVTPLLSYERSEARGRPFTELAHPTTGTGSTAP